jgi:hypothetical protein
MAWGTLEERRAGVTALAEKAEARAVEYRARESSYRTRGNIEKADKQAVTAARQERIATAHRQEIDRLEIRASQQARAKVTAAQRAEDMERAQERARAAAAAQPAIDPLEAYLEALTTAAKLDQQAILDERKARGYVRAGDPKKADIATRGAQLLRTRAREWRDEADTIQAGTTRDLPRELKVRAKAQRRLVTQEKNEANRLGKLGVVSDLATAAGQREIASGGAGRGEAIASFRDYASLIRRPQDRSQRRLEAMEAFDTLCSKAEAGLFPELKLERESSSGHGPGETIMAARVAGLAEVEEIKGAIGARNFDMLRAWVYERQTLIALVRGGYGTEKTIGALAIAAVDSLIVYFNTRNALAARLAGTGSPSQPQSSARQGDQVEPRSPSPEHRTPSSGSAPASRPRAKPAARTFPSNHLPRGRKPERTTIACRGEISDDARRTIRERAAASAQD